MQQNRVAILLNGSITNDSRMIKITKTISKYALVDLFCIKGLDSDTEIFDQNVHLIFLSPPSGFYNKLIRHTFFYKEFNYFIDKVLQQKVKYTHVYACDLPMLEPAYKVKKALDAELIYDSHELYIEGLNQFFPSYNTSSFLKKQAFDLSLKIMYQFGKFNENKLVQHVDYFITTSNSYKNYFESNYNVEGIHKVMNCPPVLNREKLIDYREKFNWKDTDFIAIYQGLMNPGRGLHLLIEAIKDCPDNIKLIFLGYGTLEEKLKQQTKDLALEHKIKFVEKVHPDNLIGYTMAADLGVNLLENINLNKKLASTNKLFEYIHANLPVLVTNTPENQYVLEKYDVGFYVENTIESLCENLIKAANSNRTELKENCKIAVKEFNWENQIKVFEKIFN